MEILTVERTAPGNALRNRFFHEHQLLPNNDFDPTYIFFTIPIFVITLICNWSKNLYNRVTEAYVFIDQKFPEACKIDLLSQILSKDDMTIPEMQIALLSS